VSTPHDALFKFVFSQPEHAASELRAVLPSDVAARLDWSSLRLVPESFVDAQLKERHSDLLFSVSWAGRPALLYLLLEHQSSTDPLMAFRMLRYVVRIWERVLLAAPTSVTLPVVIPLVVHHDATAWSAPTDLVSMLDVEADAAESLSGLLPRFRFLLDDLTDVRDDELRARSLTAVASIGLLLLARGRTSSDLAADLRSWLDVLAEATGAPSSLDWKSGRVR